MQTLSRRTNILKQFALAVACAAAGIVGTLPGGAQEAAPAQVVAPAGPETYTPSAEERQTWDKLLAQGIEKIVFVKRFTYNSNHYYTEYLNTTWMPGGNLCVISLKTGEVKELAPSLTGGVFGAFDISFDAKRIVFAYKSERKLGYRLYEVNADGTGLRQLTFSPPDEQEIIQKYNIAGYHHGTEDLDPCYLPDGGIAFVSTRCRYGILCDGPDIFTTTVLYRMDGDGNNMRKLTNSALSECTPSLLPDGRILYTRWEYVDKGAVSVKCLWAMMPDGSGTVEIYGNDIAFPTTMTMARAIPGSPNEYVFTGAPHYPQNSVGTIVRVDTTKDIRTRAPMTYMTPYVDIRGEGGFSFRDPKNIPANPDHGWSGSWSGPLFRESFPLSRTEFLVSHKPNGPQWDDKFAYQLYHLQEGGAVTPIYTAKGISSFRPIPLVPRKTPPVLASTLDETLAAQKLAECIVTDVYKGMDNVPEGTVKYLRVLEQVPRPWGARRFYRPRDEYDQQHAAISQDTHLGLKIQHGLVTVERDGSARFLVPAERNIFLQALDANLRAVQTERTYVNYMPGEIRSCVGCHESNSLVPAAGRGNTPLAMKRKAEVPYAQPGEKDALRTLSYARDVQPIWDKHCVTCHNATETAPAKLNLTNTETDIFNASYENLVPRYWRRGRTNRGLLAVIGENHPKTGNIEYLPPRSLGAHASILTAMFDKTIVLQKPEDRERAAKLAATHSKIKLNSDELRRLYNWVDTNCQYYGTYYGRRNRAYKDHPDYRTEYDVQTALSPQTPVPFDKTSVPAGAAGGAGAAAAAPKK